MLRSSASPRRRDSGVAGELGVHVWPAGSCQAVKTTPLERRRRGPYSIGLDEPLPIGGCLWREVTRV